MKIYEKTPQKRPEFPKCCSDATHYSGNNYNFFKATYSQYINLLYKETEFKEQLSELYTLYMYAVLPETEVLVKNWNLGDSYYSFSVSLPFISNMIKS